MSAPVSRLRAVPPAVPRPVAGRVLLAMTGAALALILAGAMQMAGDVPRQVVLHPLTRPGGWQRAMVADGVQEVADRAEAAARRSGAPAALTDGATLLASLAGATGDAARSTDLLRRSLALAEAALAQAPLTAQAQFIAGAAQAALGGAEDAASRDLARAAALDPNNAHLRRRIGLVELQRGRPQQAALHFRVALAADPGLALPLYRTLRDLGSPLAPAEATPATPRAQVALGGWLDSTSDPAGAETAYRQAVQLAEMEGEPAVHMWSYRQLFGSLMSHERFAEAERLTARMEASSIQLAPADRAVLLYDRGLTLLGRARPLPALPFLEQAVSLSGDSIDHLNAYATALAATGQCGDAAAIWGQALSVPRRTAAERSLEIPMRMARCRCLEKSGQRQAGLMEARRILMADPDHAEARALIKELAYE